MEFRASAALRRGLRPALCALALTFLVAGCGGDAPSDDADLEGDLPGAMDDPSVEAAPSPMDTMVHVTVTLAAMNESGVSGEAMAMHSDDAVVVILELEGLPGEGQYNAHIHDGNCAAGGPVRVALNPVAGLADGTGTSTTTLEASELSETDPHFIMVHGEGGTPLACGDVEGHGEG
jgi:hypothetical protein